MSARKPPFRGASDIQRQQHRKRPVWIGNTLLTLGWCAVLVLLWARSQGWLS
jgi:hypothetical protein